jgi:charged multivesicular body protein 4A/B
MKLFGKAQKAPTPKDALGKLKETLDMLQKREDYLQTKIAKELTVAKQNASKNKRSMYLRKLLIIIFIFVTAWLVDF